MTVVHQNDMYKVVLNDSPIALKDYEGRDYWDNYHVVHTQHKTVEMRTENYFAALHAAEELCFKISNKHYMKSAQLTLQDFLERAQEVDDSGPSDPSLN